MQRSRKLAMQLFQRTQVDQRAGTWLMEVTWKRNVNVNQTLDRTMS